MDELLSIDTRKRADQVRDSIVNLIRTQELNPGDKLPTERQLMEALGVGRSTVREALNSLAGLGVVEARPGQGFYVSRTSLEDLMHVLSGALHLESPVSWRLVEARSIIEVAAARLAAERSTIEDEENLEQAIRELRAAFEADDLDAIIAADSAFHTALVQATHNDVLVEMLKSIEPWLLEERRELYRRRLATDTFTDETVVGTHTVIVEAIRAGDVDQAEREMREHLHSIWEQVRIWPLV